MTRNGQGMKKSREWSVGGLVVSIHSAYEDICLGVSIYIGPQEMSFHEGQHTKDSQVASKWGSLEPLGDLRAD